VGGGCNIRNLRYLKFIRHLATNGHCGSWLQCQKCLFLATGSSVALTFTDIAPMHENVGKCRILAGMHTYSGSSTMHLQGMKVKRKQNGSK
jgi:hypothetical protein